MTTQRLTGVFALFFDPRIPVLFISGSIVLAIAGNGAYDLIVGFVGATPQTLTAIVLSALLILGFVTLAFRAVLRVIARRQINDRTIVSPEEIAAPHVGLVLPVGPSGKAADKDIIAWHMQNNTLRHCWMIVSEDVERSQKFRDLEYWLRSNNIRPYPLPIQDPTQANLSYEAVKMAVLQARKLLGSTPFIVDITGGIKLMTAGAVLACRDFGVPVQYWDSLRDEQGNFIPGTARPRMVSLRSASQDAML